MKKFIVLLFVMCFSLSVFGQSKYTTVKEKVVELVSGDSKNCPVYEDTPFKDISRADIDLAFMVDLVDMPGDGRVDLYFMQNYHIQGNLNFGSTFFFYAGLGKRTYKKTPVSDAVYDDEWDSQEFFGGFGLYIFPVLKIHAGAVKIIAEDYSDNSPDVPIGIEWGAAYDRAWGRNKIVFGIKSVEISYDEENVTAAELQKNPTHIVMSIGLSIPFMR